MKKQKIPFKLKVLRFKNSGFFNFLDAIIYKLKPPKKYKGIPKKILFIRNDRIGDALLTIPVLRDLKLNYPDLRTDILVSSRNKFVFENLKYIDKVILFEPKNWDQEKLPGIFKIILIGHALQFIFFFVIPYLFNSKFRTDIKDLKNEKYDAVIDLKGNKRNPILSKMISPFTLGPKLFGLAWLYTYYTELNWVTSKDKDFITRKIQLALSDGLNFEFSKKEKHLPFSENIEVTNYSKEYDIFIHIGTSELRKLTFEQESRLLENLRDYKVLLTDSEETTRFIEYKNKYNFTFKLYDSLTDTASDAARSKIVVCYDGGQAHILSQFAKTITIFGPGSVNLWKPYEFEDYELLNRFDNGTKAIISKGQYRHIAVYYPVWCSPCFDVGCKTRPCIANIDIESLSELIKNELAKK